MAGDVVADRWFGEGGIEFYKCRAWVNFNGTGVVSIRAAGNVSSITDNGAGDYTVNFTNAMPDANYSGMAMSGPGNGRWMAFYDGVLNDSTDTSQSSGTTATSLRIAHLAGSTDPLMDNASISVAIFR